MLEMVIGLVGLSAPAFIEAQKVTLFLFRIRYRWTKANSCQARPLQAYLCALAVCAVTSVPIDRQTE